MYNAKQDIKSVKFAGTYEYEFSEDITIEGTDASDVEAFEQELRELVDKYGYRITRGF